jgi:hypothetical protein
MSALHGSSIPGALEGAPFHNDSFLLTFNSVADSNGVAVFVGAIVTLSNTAGFTCVIGVTQAKFILGVAQTSGQLQAAIDVICRGEVTITVDNSVTAGDFVDVSTTSGHDGYGSSVTTTPTRMVSLQTVNGSTTPSACVVLLF